MDIGSEIGTKMRSAVKAKLLELGSGDTAGYIDDELPDYIMIMIANKRSKSQMVADLELFLGNKTTHFVHWLHEVLQKLQEVTIPTPIAKPASGKKTKIVENKKAENKKEKRLKDAKKDKTKTNKMQTSNVTSKIGDFNSINDVVAEHLLEKAKKDLDITSLNETAVKKGKETKNNASSTAEKTDNVPATSEITSSTDVSGGVVKSNSNMVITGNRDKDLAELAEIQRRIYAAKKHLKEIGELDEQLESEDEDFLNLKDDESSQDFDVGDDMSHKSQDNEVAVKKITSNTLKDSEVQPSTKQQQQEIDNTTIQTISSEKLNTKKITSEHDTESSSQSKQSNESEQQQQKDNQMLNDEQAKKRPVHERLGMRQQPANQQPDPEPSRRSRIEKQLYVPAFRRHEKESERKSERGRERVRERERSRERSREPERSRGERERERERDARQRYATNSRRPSASVSRRRSSSQDSIVSNSRDRERQRIGSRVIVAAHKPASPSESDEERPLNSVIKIKPRAPVSPSKQASKNLLMRAMADAQRSTILSKSSSARKDIKSSSSRVKERLGAKPEREQLKRSANSTSRNNNNGGVALFRRTTQNLIIEVGASDRNREKRRRYNNDVSHAEYATKHISDRSESEGDQTYGGKKYQPRRINDYESNKSNYKDYDEMYNEDDADDGLSVNKTQFVVTLNDDKTSAKYGNSTHMRSRSNSPQPQVSSSSSARRDRARQTHSNVRSRLSAKATSSSSISPRGAPMRLSERESNNSTPINMSPTRGQRIEVYRKPNEVKKLIIQNDTDDDEYSPKKRYESVERTPKKSSTESEAMQSSPRKRKLTPIKYRAEENLDKKEFEEENDLPAAKRRSGSVDKHVRDNERNNELSQERSRKISIRNTEARKYDHIPALSSVALDSAAIKVIKPKQLCKFHPNCTKSFCEYYHPKSPCKAFPNCKYGEKCMYSHPNCKYDLACTNLNCNYQHSGPRNPSQLQPTAPPLSSHVVPVQNYKTISAINQVTMTVDNTRGSTCKYFPNCTKVGCTFVHPKLCRYGKNCINPTCNYYHHDAPSSSKFKWVASLV